MAATTLAEVVIIVSGTHWRCMTCRLHQQRTASLDAHLKEIHPYIPFPPLLVSNPVPVRMPVLSDGDEYEDVKEIQPVTNLRTAKKQKDAPEVSQWLKEPDLCDSSDDVEDFDNDDDSDFIPAELEKKLTKQFTRTTRNALQKQPKKKIMKRVRVHFSMKKIKTEQDAGPTSEQEVESASETEPHIDPQQTQPGENTEDQQKPPKKRRSAEVSNVVKGKSPQRKRKASEPLTPMEPQIPKKRGRPPKPKPAPSEEEELPLKRPYRKRVPDPSELLLKLRNVGRKPNTRKKLSGDEKSEIESRYVHVISKGNTEANTAEFLHSVPVDSNDSANADNDRKKLNQDESPLNHRGDISLDTQSSSASQLKPTKEKIRCRTCLLVFSSERFLQEHMTSVCKEDVVECAACEMKFHGLVDLNLHVFCDHEYEKQPSCFLCKDDYKSMEKLEKHLYQSHRGEGERKLMDTRFHDCRLCHMELNIDFQLIKNHYYRRHKAYVCPECYGKEPELLYYTDTHLYTEHKQMHAKSPAECSICHQVFPTARDMKTHMWSHANDQAEDGTGGKCSKCDKWLPNSGAMLMHEKEHKNEAIRKNYALEASIGFPCMKCEHIFSSKSNLKKHSCKADPNRTFYFHCEYCAHGCNTKEQLRDHIALHHLGIKRYACDFCDQRFVCAPTLRRHVRRVHTKEKPYECHICKERFFERNLMLRHVSKHTGIASFMCEFCGKGFHTKFDLKKHVENHTDTRDFVCPNCGLDYKRSYHLKRHLEKGCWKKFVGKPKDGKAPSVVSEAPLASQEDPDEMVYIDLADDVKMDNDNSDDNEHAEMESYNDESSGPDYVDDDMI